MKLMADNYEDDHLKSSSHSNQTNHKPSPDQVMSLSLFFIFKGIFTVRADDLVSQVVFPDMFAVSWNKSPIPECSERAELDVAVV